MAVKRIKQHDVFAAVVPEGVDLTDRASLLVLLDDVARSYVHKQWQGRRRPLRIEFATSQWLITSEPGDVEQFQPADGCAACLSGNDQSIAYLRDNPGRSIAMANLVYTEVWPG